MKIYEFIKARLKEHLTMDELAANQLLEILDDHAATDETHHTKVAACRQCTDSIGPWRVTCTWDVADRVAAPCDTVRMIAEMWPDHAEYMNEWKV